MKSKPQRSWRLVKLTLAAVAVVVLAVAGYVLLQPPSVDVAGAQLLRSQSNVVLVDVREPNEYAAGHIPGSVLIPLGQLPSRLSEIPKDQQIITICRTGRRSAEAATLLINAGYDARTMTGGMVAWSKAGQPVDR